MELDVLFKVMDKFDDSQSTYLEYDFEGCHIKLKKEKEIHVINNQTQGVQFSQPITEVSSESSKEDVIHTAAEDIIKAPIVGTFYRASAPDKEPFVKPGSSVKAGDIICMIEAMKMMSEVNAPKDCIIEEILVENADVVGYEQPLFRIKSI